ncbi:MAG TPA: caspase family protein [Acidimicrobiales bacterium]|nr:caspase family protein [Acidimicrobiales bacterium]
MSLLARPGHHGERARPHLSLGGRAGSADAIAASAPQSDPPPTPTVAEKPIAPPPEVPAALSTAGGGAVLNAAGTSGGGVWAVIIGIDDYPGTRSDLRASVADANTVDWALARYGVGADRRLVLRDTQASAAVIGEAMRWLVARAGPDATAVVFYAGHVRKLSRGREAIVAADGKLITDLALAELLRPLAAGKTWIAMASCYGGGFTEVLGPNRILSAAADAHSLAYENEQYGNSYFVEYMVERAMVHGRAAESVEQSFAWAHAALTIDHPRRTPVQYDQVPGELRLGTPNPVPPSQPTQPNQPSPSQPSPQPAPPPEEEDDDDGPTCLLVLGSLANCDERDRGR